MSGLTLRRRIVADAKTWIDTPYYHQAARKGAGCDCLGLVRGIWQGIYGEEPTDVPPYTPNWAEQNARETLLEAARQWLIPIENAAAAPGDVLLFRMHPKAPCKHLAVLSGPTTMIHAYWGRAVTESHLVPYWSRRWAYSFAFPQI